MQAASDTGVNLESTYFVLFPCQVVLFWWVMPLFSLIIDLTSIYLEWFSWIVLVSSLGCRCWAHPSLFLAWSDCIQALWQSRGCIWTAFLIDTIVVFTIVIFFQFWETFWHSKLLSPLVSTTVNNKHCINFFNINLIVYNCSMELSNEICGVFIEMANSSATQTSPALRYFAQQLRAGSFQQKLSILKYNNMQMKPWVHNYE